MSHPVFQPETYGVKLQSGYSLTPRFVGVSDESELGLVTSTLLAERQLRAGAATFRSFTTEGKEYVGAFFREIGGEFGRFLYSFPELIESPALPPTVTAIAGGSLAQRDYLVSYALIAATGQTRASPRASITVAANELLRVTVPFYPANVTSVAIYVTDGAAGTEVQQKTLVNGNRVWTEPDAALLTGTASPQTTNTATEQPLLRLTGPVAHVRGIGPSWDFRIQFEEDYLY